jgi:hypothetical protein
MTKTPVAGPQDAASVQGLKTQHDFRVFRFVLAPFME